MHAAITISDVEQSCNSENEAVITMQAEKSSVMAPGNEHTQRIKIDSGTIYPGGYDNYLQYLFLVLLQNQ